MAEGQKVPIGTGNQEGKSSGLVRKVEEGRREEEETIWPKAGP